MKNKYCHYTSSCIMKIYTLMYNKNVCCYYIITTNIFILYRHYTSSRITRYTLSCVIKYLMSLNIFLYKRNKYFIIHLLV